MKKNSFNSFSGGKRKDKKEMYVKHPIDVGDIIAVIVDKGEDGTFFYKGLCTHVDEKKERLILSTSFQEDDIEAKFREVVQHVQKPSPETVMEMCREYYKNLDGDYRVILSQVRDAKQKVEASNNLKKAFIEWFKHD